LRAKGEKHIAPGTDQNGNLEPNGIGTSYLIVKEAIDSLSDLRQIAGKAQADVAAALKIKQPSVSKIEKQADMHLSTLRSYVEAIGGHLELVIAFPKGPALKLQQFGDASNANSTSDLSDISARPKLRRRRGRVNKTPHSRQS
jgi:hypothetical protein